MEEGGRRLGVVDSGKVVGSSRCGRGWQAFRSCRIGKRVVGSSRFGRGL